MVEDCSHKAVVESSSLSISTVLVAQPGRAEDCGSLWHGFKSHLTPQYTHIAQLVRALILVYPPCLIHSRKGNRLHVGSIPSTSTILEYLSGLRAQTANLMIRGFKSHLQVYVLYR